MVCTTMNVLVIIRCTLFAIKITFLLLLAFGKDLGLAIHGKYDDKASRRTY